MSASIERTVASAGLGWPDPEPTDSHGLGWPPEEQEAL